MSYTIPTPRTDALRKKLDARGESVSWQDWEDLTCHARTLERELTAMTKERDALREAGYGLEKGLNELNRIYRGEQDEPGPTPPFIRDPIAAWARLTK